LQHAAADAYGKLGLLLEKRDLPAESLEAHQEAVKILQQLLARKPANYDLQRQLALAENNCGLALLQLGKATEAREQFQQAAQRQERLLARSPRDTAV